MPVQHFLMTKETVVGTWVDPTNAFPIETFQVAGNDEYLEGRDTGEGRGLRRSWLGARGPSGSLTAKAYTEFLGYFLRAAGLTPNSALSPSASAAYEHHWLPVEAANPTGYSYSVQAQHTTAVEQNLRGFLIDTLEFSVAAKEILMMNMDWFAIDEVDDAGTWDDGNSAPAQVASPTYFGNTITPFFFYDCAITTGGTPSKGGDDELTISGGSNQAFIEDISISMSNGVDNPHFVDAGKVPARLAFQERSISGSFTLDWSVVDKTFYNQLKAGTKAAIRLALASAVEIESGYPYMLNITLPSVTIRSADLPEVSGSQSRRKQSVEFMAEVESSLGTDIGISLFDGQSSY